MDPIRTMSYRPRTIGIKYNFTLVTIIQQACPLWAAHKVAIFRDTFKLSPPGGITVGFDTSLRYDEGKVVFGHTIKMPITLQYWRRFRPTFYIIKAIATIKTVFSYRQYIFRQHQRCQILTTGKSPCAKMINFIGNHQCVD